MKALGWSEPNGWQRVGKLPGPRMWALDFMRIERVPYGRSQVLWRAWDVLHAPEVRPMYPTTFHRTLRDAKAHCERIVGGSK